MTIEQAIEEYEKVAYFDWFTDEQMEVAQRCKQIADWLRELQERRKAPEIVTCYECKHYTPVSQTSNSWGKCSVHSSPTEKQRTCQSCDYCSWAERRTE